MAFRHELTALIGDIRAAILDQPDSDVWTDVDTLTARWEFFGEGDPELVDALITGLDDDVRGRIESAVTDIGRVNGVVGQWHGSAAETFRQEFVGSYETAVQHQLDAVRDLSRILRAYDGVMAQGRRTILDIGRATRDALGGGGPPVHFFVVGAAAAAAGPPGTGSLLDAIPAPQPAQPTYVAGETTADVLNSMDTAVTLLRGFIDAEEDLIGAALDSAQFRLDLNLPTFLAGSDDSGGALTEFEQPSVDHLIVEVAGLYRAGSVDMMSAADGYEQAWRRLDLSAATEPAAFGPWFARTLPDYRTLRQTFSSQVLLATRDRLVERGDDLCAVALLYAEADGHSAEEVLRASEGFW